LNEIENEMAQPEVLSDQQRMTALAREHRRLRELIEVRNKLLQSRKSVADLHDLINDPDFAEIAAEELPKEEEALATLERQIKTLVLPEPPEDARSAVLEIRAGTGGEEASLFGADLLKMYQRYFEMKRWKQEVVTSSFSDLGGVKEFVLTVSGDGVYGKLKWESGVHRVQRVPETEASGRVHTSAATVAVLPEAEEVDVHIEEKDLRIDTYRSSGPGGQHVNKTESAIRITHIPSGLVVTCQDEKSQLKNRIQAMKVLRSRLYQQRLDTENEKRASERRSQVGTGDRSAKIRTYNFPQNRVTDHRAGITIYQLENLLEGNLDQLLTPLIEYFAEERLKELAKG
jgi:peptide chain release factor 1